MQKQPYLAQKNWKKYGFKPLEKMNNFLHRIFFQFGMDFN
jgi:hypothetical protein